MKLKAGTRVKSAVCATEVMVIQAPDADLDLRCGGAPMLAIGETAPAGGGRRRQRRGRARRSASAT